jgi:hypothetical protein
MPNGHTPICLAITALATIDYLPLDFTSNLDILLAGN